jgi:hypothetical protein
MKERCSGGLAGLWLVGDGFGGGNGLNFRLTKASADYFALTRASDVGRSFRILWHQVQNSLEYVAAGVGLGVISGRESLGRCVAESEVW